MLIFYRAVGPEKIIRNATKSTSIAPKARDIPAWGEAPGKWVFLQFRAESPVHNRYQEGDQVQL